MYLNEFSQPSTSVDDFMYMVGSWHKSWDFGLQENACEMNSLSDGLISVASFSSQLAYTKWSSSKSFSSNLSDISVIISNTISLYRLKSSLDGDDIFLLYGSKSSISGV